MPTPTASTRPLWQRMLIRRLKFLAVVAVVLVTPVAAHATTTSIRIDPSTTPQPALREALLTLDRHNEKPLNAAALANFKSLIAHYGWPTVPAVGREGVDAAGDLACRAASDYDFQNALESAMQQRIGIDVNARAFAALNDRIEAQHGHPQQFGSLLALDHGKVVTAPIESATAANPYRDSIGLPLLAPWLDQVQQAVDGGISLATAAAPPALAAPFHAPTLPRLRAELDAMATADQDARNAWVKDGLKPNTPAARRTAQLDTQHLQRLRAIVDHYGFPDAAQVGRDGVEDFWLLAQHAMGDITLMGKVLALSRPLMLKGDLPRGDYAKMADRVRLKQGRKQLYGTQASIKQGHFVLYPVEDAAHLDQRRADMGLMPEADYLKMGERMLHPAAAPATEAKS